MIMAIYNPAGLDYGNGFGLSNANFNSVIDANNNMMNGLAAYLRGGGNNTTNGMSAGVGLNAVGNPSSGGFLSGLNNFFGSDTFKALGGIGQLAMQGLGAYSALQGLGLAKDQLNLANKSFNFQKGLANRNLANQAKTINNAYDNAAQVAAGMTGSFGLVDPATVKRYEDNAKRKHVDASPIN